MNSRTRTLLATLAASLACGLSYAQTTPPPPPAAAPKPAATEDEEEEKFVEMSPFVVTVQSDSGFRASESTSGTLVARPLEKLPMGISVVSSEMMKEIGILNADGLAKIIPGLAAQNVATSQGTGDNTFYTNRGFNSIPRRNGFAPGGRLYDMTGVDRVEVIKGPNSLLYGQSDPGGIINYITKRPRLAGSPGVRGTASAGYGSYDYHRFFADVDATAVGGKFGVRVPASYTSHGREFTWYENEVIAANPSLLWRIFPRTELYAEYEYLEINTKRASFQPIVWTPPGGTEFVDKDKRGLGREFTLDGPHARQNNLQKNYTVDLTSRLNDNLTFRAVYSKNNRDRDELVPTGGDPFRATPTGYRGQWFFDGNEIMGWKADLLGEYTLGKIETRTVLGYEYNENEFFVTGWRTYDFNANAPRVLYTLNVGFDPITGKATRVPVAADFAPLATVSAPSTADGWRIENGPSRFRSEWTNMRVNEVLSAWDDRVQLLGGVARGKSTLVNLLTNSENSQSVTVFQAGLGVAIDPKKQHMVYVNHSTSYQPQFLFDINNDPLPSQEGTGTEAGIKSVWGDTGLTTTLAVFTQERTNIGRQYNDPVLNRTYGVLTPGEETQGWEAEIWYRPTNQLDLHFAYTQFNGEITGVLPGREFLLGRELPRSPEQSAQFFSQYRFDSDNVLLKGLRIGLGGTWKNDTWLDLGQGQFTLATRRSDSYFVMWATIAKEFKLEGRQAVTVALNIGNLLDEDYIHEGNAYGDPRTFRLSAEYRF